MGSEAKDGGQQSISFMNSKPSNPKPAALKTAALSGDGAPHQLVEWGLEYFSDVPMILTSAFGMEGCALINMCSKAIEAASLEPLTFPDNVFLWLG